MRSNSISRVMELGEPEISEAEGMFGEVTRACLVDKEGVNQD
jgi:hypothetical protein